MSLTDLAWVSGSTSNTIRRSVTLSGAAKVMPRWRHSSTSYFGVSYSYLTNSSCAVWAKSVIGNTDLNTACKPSLGRPPFGASIMQELVVGSLLHLDQVRHRADFPDVAEDLANPFAAGECLRHVAPQSVLAALTEARRRAGRGRRRRVGGLDRPWTGRKSMVALARDLGSPSGTGSPTRATAQRDIDARNGGTAPGRSRDRPILTEA